MAVAVVDVQVRSSDAVKELQRVNNTSNQLNQTITNTNGKLRDASGRFVKLGEAAQQSRTKVGLLTNTVKNLASQLVVADLARRFFKGFDEADRAAAAVRTLGVDSKTLQTRLLGVSNRLGGLYSQTQLVTAAYDVASSGFTDAADAAKVLEAAAKGATGGLSDINTVGNAVTSVLNAYGKSANDAAILVDGFIQTQNDGKIVLNEYAQQIGKLAPTAAATGVGINELNAAISTITAQGVPVEATFTGLNQALVSILKPSKEASDLAKALGINFSETGLRANGFGGLLKEVKEKTGGSTTALVKLFGSVDALKAVLPLVNDDLVKYNKNVEKQANVSGVADKATQELGGTVSSEITKMVNQIGNLARSLDVVLGPALGGILKLINFVIGQAAQGILVLGQLFSMTPGKQLAFEAVQSGNLGAAARVLPGIDETIGEKRRKQLQQQAGAGTGLFGLGMSQDKFIKLLQQQPEFKVPATAGDKPATVVDPALQALLDKLLADSGGGDGKTKGGGGANKAANEAKQLAERLRTLDSETILNQKLVDLKQLQFNAGLAEDQQLLIRLKGNEEILKIAQKTRQEIAKATNPKERQLLLDQMVVDVGKTHLNTAQELIRAAKDQSKPLDDIVKASKEKLEDDKAALLLQQQGMSPELAKQFVAIDKAAKLEKERLEPLIAAAEAAVIKAQAEGQDVSALQKQLSELKARAGIQSQTAKDNATANDQATQAAEAAAQLKAIYQDIGMTIKDGVVGAIKGAVDGTKSLGQVASEVLSRIADKVLDVAINMALFGAMSGTGTGGGLLGSIFGGKRAMGGSVTGGRSYMVGERGPELFSPGRSGGIAPTGSFGGSTNVVVNVDASGSSVEGDQSQAKALGNAISAAVQSELVKQKRPGGLLA
jgi:TP901 family phage tail tape measure protein